MKGVYIIPCSCRTPDIGETGRSINQRICEHSADMKHGGSVLPHWQNTQKRLSITYVLRRHVLLPRLPLFVTGNLGRPLKLKRGRAISIGMMAGKLAVAGSLPFFLSAPLVPTSCVVFL